MRTRRQKLIEFFFCIFKGHDWMKHYSIFHGEIETTPLYICEICKKVQVYL